MSIFTVPTVGAVATNNATPAVPTEAIGAAPQWADNSDATHVIVRGVYQGGGTGISGSGTADLANGIDIGTNPEAVVKARVRLSEATGKPLPFASIIRPNGTGLLSGGQIGVSPLTPTWVEIPVSGGGLGLFQLFTATGQETLRLKIDSPLGFVFPPGVNTFAWTIYEAEIVITTPGGVAPPLKLWPRDDEWGVGGAAQVFPDPTSSQGSSRVGGAGGYD